MKLNNVQVYVLYYGVKNLHFFHTQYYVKLCDNSRSYYFIIITTVIFSYNIVPTSDERQSLMNCMVIEAIYQKALPKMYYY